MKKAKVLGLLLALMLLAVGCGKKNNTAEQASANEPAKEEQSAETKDFKIVLKLSHVFAPEEQLTKSTDAAAKAIYERTNGAVEIQTYPQGQLPTYKDGLEQVYNGADFISVEDPSYLGDYVPDFKALVGPFIYSDIDQYTNMIKTDLVQDMIKKAEDEHGIKVLALDYVFGFRNMMTNKEIKEPADLKGMKIRVPGSQIFIDTINAMGATATPMAFSETISAVQQGVVDGLEGTVDAMTANGSAEVVKNVGLTKHFLGTCGIYINKDVFNKIPKEYQEIIQEEFTKNAQEMTSNVKTNYDAQVKYLEEKGIAFNEVNLPAFQEATKVVFEKMEGISPDIYQKLLDEIAKMK
ncbi:C4-dicarboxylate TRAP transporter substrate-binding protein [Peptoniphilus sp. oral taxon 386]|uniref:C4-dicarboxylate TRAP transporter substrate-binding protein n=1 Tax=Peptoniphilus sp. oral taxon 386 TaxID=652713 RepID=UPI0001DA9DDF|nr:C4-dicarboxylate TRAP transporter substrate-binding protein [Peptoniphilus sp. oral taxon 386]EFI41442.1 bacterial extracellular solute-binding protein, family 7 [Peptoniphilus sp. oral taxon 386 str. F0131]